MNCPECGAPLDAEQEQVREATECETVAGIVAWLRANDWPGRNAWMMRTAARTIESRFVKTSEAPTPNIRAGNDSVCEQSASLETGVNATAAPASASEEPAFDAEARGWLTHILEDLYGDGDEEEADDLVDSLASRLQNAYERGRRSKR